MCVVLGYSLYPIANGTDSILIYRVPTLLGPLSIFTLLFSTKFTSEIKKREKNNL
ncbi:hypothetical protein FB2170_13948 [Maribacter sp. HTCC2170]|nr:hypothetical protein FB2170_13948 [Maribacter sp. HTCC2170]